MFTNNLGYIFGCRYDHTNSCGVLESFKVMFKGIEQRVTVTLAVDSNGDVVVPFISDISLGFKPLNITHNTPELVNKFVKSNKHYFGKLGEFSMLVSGTIIFNKDTKELISADGLNFYVPKTLSNNIKELIDNRGVQQPALICEKLSTSEGLNLFKVSEKVKEAYLSRFLSCIDAKAAEDRNTFLQSITFKE